MADLPKTLEQIAYEEWQNARIEYMRLMQEHIDGKPHAIDEVFPLINMMNDSMVRLMKLVKPEINWKI